MSKATDISAILKQLRDRGWLVAVHNDYLKDGRVHTFWLFTASHGPYFAKGESTDDYYALNQVLNRVDDIEKWCRGLTKYAPLLWD
jgi:hypothetical protein